jgi:hypothetical protein
MIRLAVILAPTWRLHCNVVSPKPGEWMQWGGDCLYSLSVGEGGDRHHRFFLVMAHWQLGNREQSRHYYSQAIAALPPDLEKRTDTKADELRRFRAEAEALMGLKSEE